MEDVLIKPDIVLVTKNLMVPLALPVPENKFFPAPRTSRKKTKIVRARKSRLSPGRADCSGKSAMLQTNVELLRSSDYLACDYDSLVDWEQDLHKNYEPLYSKGLALGKAGFGDSRSEGNGRLDSLSQGFPERCKTFSSINDEKDNITNEVELKQLLFGGSRQKGIDLGDEKDDLGIFSESFKHCGKGHTLDEIRTMGNKNQNCSSRNFPEHPETFSATNNEKDKISDGAEGKEMLFGDSREGNAVWRQTGIELGEEKNNPGILTMGRHYNKSFNRYTETDENKRQNHLSRNFLEHCKKFSLLNDEKDKISEETKGQEMLFVSSRQSGIDLGGEKNDLGTSTSGRDCNKSFDLCGKGHTRGESETKGNKKQDCLSQSFSERYKSFSLQNDEKYKISDGAEGKEMLFGGSRQNGIDLGEEKNNLGISTRGRDYNESFNRCGKESTPGVISGEAEAEGNRKQNCLSQSFPASSTATAIGTKMLKTSLLSDRKDKVKEETDRKKITSDDPTEKELKIFDANIRWKSRESSATELRRCASSATSLERSKSSGKEADKGPKVNECEMKYSWQDLENWVPPSAKKRIAKIDERSDLTGAKKLDCKITYSWQIIGTGAQTSYELIRSLLTSAEEEEEGKRVEEAANYPCAVKYSWQIIGTGTQVSFRRDNEDSLPIDGDYWNGKILKPRKRFVEGSIDGKGPKIGSSKILYSEMTQTVIDESHQTELGDCRVKYSWQNLTKPYLEKIRRL